MTHKIAREAHFSQMETEGGREAARQQEGLVGSEGVLARKQVGSNERRKWVVRSSGTMLRSVFATTRYDQRGGRMWRAHRRRREKGRGAWASNAEDEREVRPRQWGYMLPVARKKMMTFQLVTPTIEGWERLRGRLGS